MKRMSLGVLAIAVALGSAAPLRAQLIQRTEGFRFGLGVGATLPMGDYGRLDADGELLFFDRGADLIRLDGAVVSSLEVEAVLYEHDAVREAAVFAAPRPGSAPEIVAAVALSDPGALADVEAFAARWAAFEQLVDEATPLPGTGSGSPSAARTSP